MIIHGKRDERGGARKKERLMKFEKWTLARGSFSYFIILNEASPLCHNQSPSKLLAARKTKPKFNHKTASSPQTPPAPCDRQEGREPGTSLRKSMRMLLLRVRGIWPPEHIWRVSGTWPVEHAPRLSALIAPPGCGEILLITGASTAPWRPCWDSPAKLIFDIGERDFHRTFLQCVSTKIRFLAVIFLTSFRW